MSQLVRLIIGQFAYLNIATKIPLGEKPFECLYIHMSGFGKA